MLDLICGWLTSACFVDFVCDYLFKCWSHDIKYSIYDFGQLNSDYNCVNTLQLKEVVILKLK